MRWLAVLSFSFACTQGDEPGPADVGLSDASSVDTGVLQDAGPAADAAVACPAANLETINVRTDDGLTLEATLHALEGTGHPGAVLLHMSPSGGNDRTNFPISFVESLGAAGFNVLNLNRRGAGTTDATLQRSAYEGPNGPLDAKAGFDRLTANGCTDTSRVFFVGASNGTTTALDYALSSGNAAALVFLTGGGYTENQSSIDNNRTALEPLPIMFVYANNEAGWSSGFETGAPSTWTFLEYMPGGHGTRMFDVRPEAAQDVVSWMAARL